jgi:hypothetical protein
MPLFHIGFDNGVNVGGERDRGACREEKDAQKQAQGIHGLFHLGDSVTNGVYRTRTFKMPMTGYDPPGLMTVCLSNRN